MLPFAAPLASARTSRFSLMQIGCDFFALGVVLTCFLASSALVEGLGAQVNYYAHWDLSLDPSHLPYYACMSTFRIFAAMFFSLIFAVIIGTIAAKSRVMERILLPLLDILQSIPVLGYTAFVITFFTHLFPARVLGVECAVIMAIFTAQVWNMAFSVYQSLKTVPVDLLEAAHMFHLSPWERFWRVEMAYSIPGLVWNGIMSIANSWFFIVASEAIAVGNVHYTLPGIGSYLASAIAEQNIRAVCYTLLSMACLMALYHIILFQPLAAWSQRFSYQPVSMHIAPPTRGVGYVLSMIGRARLSKALICLGRWMVEQWSGCRLCRRISRRYAAFRPVTSKRFSSEWIGRLSYKLLLIIGIAIWVHIQHLLSDSAMRAELLHVGYLGGLTFLRILLMVWLITLLLVPIGVYIGLRPALTRKVQPWIQFLAAFPANLLYPMVVIVIIHYQLNVDIFLSPLLVLGAQWYVLFNVIAGAEAFPSDLRDASRMFGVHRGLVWWKNIIIPGIFPYLVTGMVTAMGAAWNATIIAEAVRWGSDTLYVTGLGAYISQKTLEGNVPHITLGVCVMIMYVILSNKLIWDPLYRYAETRMHVE